MNVIESVKALNLPKNSYVVVGSSVMVVLGLAKGDDDVDLTVTQDIYDAFKRGGWVQELYGEEPVFKKRHI